MAEASIQRRKTQIKKEGQAPPKCLIVYGYYITNTGRGWLLKPDILRVHPDRMTVEIDVRVPGTYVVSEGKVEFFPIPETGYGSQVVKWHQGKWQETEGTTKYR